MAKGLGSLHPHQRRIVEHILGSDCEWAVTQGWGYAKASAGSHDPVGSYQGVRFGYCIDFSSDLFTHTFIDALAAAGFACWCRIRGQGWNGESHVHAVTAWPLPWDRDRNGNSAVGWATRPYLPQHQVDDYEVGVSGLVGDAPIVGEWRPDPAQMTLVRTVNAGAGLPVRPVVVKIGNTRCYGVYGFEFGGVSRGRLRPVVEAVGGRITFDNGLEVWRADGQQADLSHCEVADEGLSTRCRLADLGRALGKTVSWHGPSGTITLK